MDSKIETANCQAHVQLLELGRHGLALERWAVGGSWLGGTGVVRTGVLGGLYGSGNIFPYSCL